MKITAGAAALLAVALAATSPTKNYVETRSYPPISIAGYAGCSNILLTAELKGPESEEWYCPRVEWELPDGTTASEESDCSPFEKRHECAEDQTGCGLQGFRLDPNTGQYVDVVKECACTISGYPRIWRRKICAPTNEDGQPWVIHVRLSKDKRTLSYQEVRFLVK